jgi:hypothetical protein
MTHEPKPLDLSDVHDALRAAAEAYGREQFIIVGVGSLAASQLPIDSQLRSTVDIDLFPTWDASQATRWAAADLSIGNGSPFHRDHGFYIERVGEWTTQQLPSTWASRATHLHIDSIHAQVIHPLDLIYAKLTAARQKDLYFVRRVIELQVFTQQQIEDFITTETPDSKHREQLLTRLTESLLTQPDDDL